MPHEDQVRLAPRQFRGEPRRGVRQHQDVEVQPDGVQRKLHQSRKDLGPRWVADWRFYKSVQLIGPKYQL